MHHFNKYIDQALHTLEQTVDKKVSDLLDLNNKILQLDHKLNNITTPHKSQICTPETSNSTPIRLMSNSTPISHFGATKTSIDTTPIQNYFHHNLKFKHQGDVYYLQDQDFLKNSPKIEPPVTVDNALTIYSQLQ